MANKVNRVHKEKRGALTFSDIGWSAIAIAILSATWLLMVYRDQLSSSYGSLVLVIIGIGVGSSLVCIGMGLWKASYYWKLLVVAVALFWMVDLFGYTALLAGPLIDPSSFKIP